MVVELLKLSDVKNKYTLIVRSSKTLTAKFSMPPKISWLKVFKKVLINTIFLVLFCLPNTVDHHLFRLLVSSRSDYLDWLMTVPLECFAESVRFIRELDVILHINV